MSTPFCSLLEYMFFQRYKTNMVFDSSKVVYSIQLFKEQVIFVA